MKGWKTVLFSFLTILVGVVDGFNWADIIPDAAEPWVIPAIGAIVLYLRSITSTPIFKGK